MMITVMLVEYLSSTIPCSCLCIRLFIVLIAIYIVSDIFISYRFVYNFNIYFRTNVLLSTVFSSRE